ncbi:hypothetical protein KEM60_02607 [Austwickia sp. TVS 96-490-7B]|uniref:DsbA family protein n=1 Tax=Austwickia sp. TVS 96-490-7B TaxID=2830843 RepID=UPI001C5602B5|nr:thioredoxin domain-containing protein [Austwickia sp. TVS 96-490-7B]MBW3086389.1 hypothetical protein [Austwickia sp. TVS 96-490-7B]
MPTPTNDRQAKIAAASRAQTSPVKLILALVVVIVVVIGVGVTLFMNREDDGMPGSLPDGKSSPGATLPEMPLPKGVASPTDAIVATNDGKLKDGVPTLTIFEDFQCPLCKVNEDKYGQKIAEMAKAGKLNVVYYVKTFLDDNLRNDSSVKAGNAAMCAANEGKFEAVHDKLFAAQPKEGDGYADSAIEKAGQDAGLTGAAFDSWKQCVSEKKYSRYLKSVEKHTSDKLKIIGTPAFYLNGQVMKLEGVNDGQAFEAKISEMAK